MYPRSGRLDTILVAVSSSALFLSRVDIAVLEMGEVMDEFRGAVLGAGGGSGGSDGGAGAESKIDRSALSQASVDAVVVAVGAASVPEDGACANPASSKRLLLSSRPWVHWGATSAALPFPFAVPTSLGLSPSNAPLHAPDGATDPALSLSGVIEDADFFLKMPGPMGPCSMLDGTYLDTFATPRFGTNVPWRRTMGDASLEPGAAKGDEDEDAKLGFRAGGGGIRSGGVGWGGNESTGAGMVGDWTISPHSSSSSSSSSLLSSSKALGVDVSRGGGIGLLAGGAGIGAGGGAGGVLRAASMLVGVLVSARWGGLIRLIFLWCSFL